MPPCCHEVVLVTFPSVVLFLWCQGEEQEAPALIFDLK